MLRECCKCCLLIFLGGGVTHNQQLSCRDGELTSFPRTVHFGSSSRTDAVARAEALALGDEAEMRRRIRMELDDVARRRALQGYEIPRDFIIDREPFSKANHLLTDSGKPATGRLRSKCAPPNDVRGNF